jgi:hypothetical protein
VRRGDEWRGWGRRETHIATREIAGRIACGWHQKDRNLDLQRERETETKREREK